MDAIQDTDRFPNAGAYVTHFLELIKMESTFAEKEYLNSIQTKLAIAMISDILYQSFFSWTAFTAVDILS